MQHKLPFLRLISRKYPLLTILTSGLLVLACFAVIFSARFNTDVTRLIPAHAEKTARYFRLMEMMGGMEKAYIVFRADNIMDHLQDIEQIGAAVTSSRLVKNASWKISEETKNFLKKVFTTKGPLLLSAAEMQEFIRKLSPAGMERELEKTRQRLMLPGSEEGLAMADPLNFFEVFVPHLPFSDVSFDMGSGYFLTPDRKNLIMIISPAGSPRDIAFAEKFVYGMQALLNAHRRTGLSAEITGSHAITLHEASAMKKQIVLNILSSVIAVMLIFLVFFRSLKGLLYVMTPVVSAIVVTLGLALLVSGSLSEVTGAFAGLIVSLGIDLGIVLYVRYLIDMQSFPHPVECMDRSIGAVYRSITTGVITTALTFLPMVFSSFRGIRELGLLTSIGIVVCWIFLFTLASLAIRPSSGRFMEIRGLKDLGLYATARPLQVIAATVGISLFLAFFIPRVPFEGDITKLGTGNNRPRKVLESLKDSYIKEQGVFITDTAMERESALIRSIEIKESLAKDFDSLSAAGDILPPVVRQKKNLAAMAALDPQDIVRNFTKIAAEKGFDAAGFSSFAGGLRKMLSNKELITPKDVEPVSGVLDRLLINDDDQWRVIITGNLKADVPMSALGGYAVTGPAFIKQELFSILKKDTLIIGIIGLLLVNIVLFLDFGRLHLVLLCQAPVVASILCTLGIMGLTGISLNFMDAIVFVLLFGIGTDYTVHLLHRYLSDRDIGTTLLQTGKAVLVAGLTTIAGFGSIGISSYKGLATMGQVAAIGTTLCIIFSFTLIPALIGLHERGNAA